MVTILGAVSNIMLVVTIIEFKAHYHPKKVYYTRAKLEDPVSFLVSGSCQSSLS
jgi:hypothetical protein